MDYYIRSWDPDSTYPPNPQEGDVAYTITLDQSWAPVAGVKNDNLVKEEVYENGEWKEVGGGSPGPSVALPDISVAITLDDPPVFSNGSCSMTYAEMLALIPGEYDVYPCTWHITPTGMDVQYVGGNIGHGDDSTVMATYDGFMALIAADNSITFDTL